MHISVQILYNKKVYIFTVQYCAVHKKEKLNSKTIQKIEFTKFQITK